MVIKDTKTMHIAKLSPSPGSTNRGKSILNFVIARFLKICSRAVQGDKQGSRVMNSGKGLTGVLKFSQVAQSD